MTGTETGVGKTVVTASLASCLIENGIKVTPIKPFQTGVETGAVTDIEFIYSVLDIPFDIERVCPYRLQKPLSPFYASKFEKIHFEPSDIKKTVEQSMDVSSINLIEGAGGFNVPITRNYFMSDFAKDLDLKIIIVARPGLGTVNHTLLTIDKAVACGLDVLGIVISNYPQNPDLAESTNISQLREMPGIEILGILPAIENLNVEEGKTGELAKKSRDFFINRLGGNLNIDKFVT